MIVVVAIDEPHRDVESDQHVGKFSELIATRPKKSPVPELDDLGLALSRELGGALDKVKVVVCIAKEEVAVHYFVRDWSSASLSIACRTVPPSFWMCQ